MIELATSCNPSVDQSQGIAKICCQKNAWCFLFKKLSTASNYRHALEVNHPWELKSTAALYRGYLTAVSVFQPPPFRRAPMPGRHSPAVHFQATTSCKSSRNQLFFHFRMKTSLTTQSGPPPPRRRWISVVLPDSKFQFSRYHRIPI